MQNCYTTSLNIIILNRILWTSGSTKVAISEAEQLRNSGNRVKLVFLRMGESKGYEEILRKEPFIVVSRDRSSFLSPLYDYITRIFRPDRGRESRVDYDLLRSYWKTIRKEKVDLIVCHDQYTGLAGLYAHRHLGINYVVYLHEKLPIYNVPILGYFADKVEKRVLNNASKVFYSTNAIGKSLKSKTGRTGTFNMFGIELESQRPYDQKDDVIISDSFWDRGRHPSLYLDIIEHLPEKFKLVIAGNWRDDVLRKEFLSQIERKRLGGRVTLASSVPESELSALYLRSKFAIRFGFGEFGTGSAYMALKHGVPVILNRPLGLSDLVEKYGAGLVLDGEEPEEIDIKTILNFIETYDNLEAYERISKSVRESCKEYSWKAHALNLIQ